MEPAFQEILIPEEELEVLRRENPKLTAEELDQRRYVQTFYFNKGSWAYGDIIDIIEIRR